MTNFFYYCIIDLGDSITNADYMAKCFDVPKDICDFLLNVFAIIEIRGNVGNWNSVKFEIRSKEAPHNNPHVHASYGEYNLSIDIMTLEIKGNLPNKKQKYAIEWVENNREYLLTKWNEIAMSSKIPLTKSALEFETINV
ncbi:MAG: DUF4160 domain-containing protein [Bacilli bacterium]